MFEKSLIKSTIKILIVVIVLGVVLSNTGQFSEIKNISQDYYEYFFKDYEKSLVELERQYGISIEYIVDSKFIDEQGQLPPTNGKATQLDDFSIARYAKILPQVLSQYPPEVFKTHIETIKLSKILSFYSTRYGGSTVDKIIYLTDDGRDNGFSDFFIRQTFHHEFSSVLMKSRDFPTQKWLDANSPEVKYETNFENFLKSISKDRDLVGNDYFYQRGMMSKYSYSTLENDFNLFAQTVFNEPERMKDLIRQYLIIKRKYEILKEFYLSISPEFSTTFKLID